MTSAPPTIEERLARGERIHPLEAVDYVARNPSAAQRLASSAMWQLVLERSNLDSLDVRAGMNAAIRGAVLRAVRGDMRSGRDTLDVNVPGLALGAGAIITAYNGTHEQRARVLAHDTKAGTVLVEWMEDEDAA